MKHLYGMFLIAMGSHLMKSGMTMVNERSRYEIMEKIREVFHVA